VVSWAVVSVIDVTEGRGSSFSAAVRSGYGKVGSKGAKVLWRPEV
jgi:hypothetical protein